MFNIQSISLSLEYTPTILPSNYHVLFPSVNTGLSSHPQHELATRECKGYGGMVSFRIRGGLKEAQKFMKAIKVSRNISSTSLMDPPIKNHKEIQNSAN